MKRLEVKCLIDRICPFNPVDVFSVQFVFRHLDFHWNYNDDIKGFSHLKVYLLRIYALNCIIMPTEDRPAQKKHTWTWPTVS